MLVVTNFTGSKKFNARDSAQLFDVKTMAKYINAHPFWSAQIAQIEVAPSGTFELVPVIGNHIIRIGTADHLREKLDRLFVYYNQVASKTGFDKYPVLDVQYAGQVIGSKDRYASVIDSIQLQKNIQALIEKSRQAAMQDSLSEIAEFNAQVRRDSTIKNILKTLDEKEILERQTLNAKALTNAESTKQPAVKSTVQKKPITQLKPLKKGVPSKPDEKAKPKAVMKKRVDQT